MRRKSSFKTGLQRPNPKKKKIVFLGPYAVVDCNLTLCRRQSRLQHIYHGKPYAWVDLNPMPESTLSPVDSDLASDLSLEIIHIDSHSPTPISLLKKLVYTVKSEITSFLIKGIVQPFDLGG